MLLWTRGSDVLTTALRVAGQGGDTPYSQCLCAPAQVVWSRCPSLASRDGEPVSSTGTQDTLSPDGDEPKRINRHRGEHEASRKNHRVRNAGRSRCLRGDYARVFHFTLHTRLRTHRASGVPRALSQEGNGPNGIRRPRASNNRGDGACLLRRHSGACEARTRNPSLQTLGVRGCMDSGFAREERAPRNDERSEAV